MSPIRYITEYRVKKGQMLLENTNESILSIALKIGFADSNYFSRVFKSIFGMSPQKYKKEFFKE
jgi:two-component system response regulator YesN